MPHPAGVCGAAGRRAALLVAITAVASHLCCAAASPEFLHASTATVAQQPLSGLCGAEQVSDEHAACRGQLNSGPEAGEPRSSSGRRPKTCVYAIALNERPNVQSFMDACKGADLVLVADTGSNDGTPNALRAAGATVHAITIQPFRFDSARDIALSLLPADCDLCLSLDLDERLQPGWVEALEAAWASAGGLATAVQATYVDSWERDGVTPSVEMVQTKSHARWNYAWRGPIFELPYWTGAAGEERVVAAPALRIQHRPNTTRSRSSYLDLLKLGVDEDPTSARLAFHYGRELMGLQQHEAAIKELQRYLALPGATWREQRAAALRHIAHCQEMLQQLDESQAAAHRSVLEWSKSRESWLALAYASRLLNDWPTCAWAATKALGITERTPSTVGGNSAWNAAPHDELALASYHLGRHQQAVEEGERALALDPSSERLQSNLGFYRAEMRQAAAAWSSNANAAPDGDGTATAQDRLAVLLHPYQAAQLKFCEELSAGSPNPSGLPSNASYVMKDAVKATRADGSTLPGSEYPMYTLSGIDWVSRHINVNGTWEEEETRNILDRLEAYAQEHDLARHEVVLLDIGANIGWYSLQAAAQGFTVLAFEPMAQNIGALRRSLCENPDLQERLTLITTGLSNKRDRCKFYVYPGNTGNGIAACEGEAGTNLMEARGNVQLAGQFDLAPLDEVLEGTWDALHGRLAVLKIDIEGFEHHVFEGGRKFMDAVRPKYVMAEVNQMLLGAKPPAEILQMYTDLGYTLHMHGFDGEVLEPQRFAELAAARFTWGSINNIYGIRPDAASETQRIPKILHRVYLSGREQFESMRNNAASSLRPEWDDWCRTVHSQAGWQIMFWDAAAVDALVHEHYSWFLPYWAKYTTTVRRGDAARYFILHRYGGLYLDMDVECYREGYDMLMGRDLVLQEDDYGSAVINAMMASAPGHALWPVVFQVMIERSNGDVQPHTQALTGWTPFPTDPLWMTGPWALTEAVRRARIASDMSQLVGQHVWANTVVQVYPLASWYTPCWKLNQTCHQEHEDARKAGLNKLDIVGRHRYAATWHRKNTQDPASQGN